MKQALFLACIGLSLICGCGGRPKVVGDDPTVRLVEPDSVIFYAERATTPGYLLGPGDVFDVDFLFERSLNTRVTVRPDGRVALPVVDEVQAAGLTVPQLDSILTSAYSTYYREPEITVNVLEFAPLSIYVLGEVKGPRNVEWNPSMTLLQSLAHVGGVLDSGNLKSVLVLRKLDASRAYAQRVNLHDLLNGDARSFDLYLRPHDIVYVPKTFIARVNQFVDQFFRNNYWLPLFYLRGWEAFHTEDVYDTFLNPTGISVQP